MQDVHIQDWILDYIHHPGSYVLIDVRSPKEYDESHIPGAVHLPLFSDEERAEIGTIYKQQGNKEAQWKAMEIVSPKIPALLTQLKAHMRDHAKTILYCWRGGARSGAFTTFAQLAGLEVYRLNGGYREYRRWCQEQLDESLVKGKTPVVIHGMTGVGKTKILKQLSLQHPTIDLEALANHRGSVFGSIGLAQDHNQRVFDSLFIERLIRLKDATYLVMEAESKRIGKVILPDFFFEWRKHGIHISLHTSLENRVRMIEQEYVLPYQDEPWFAPKVQDAFNSIQRRLTPEQREEVQAYLANKDYRSFIRFLLVHYYDPRYTFHQSEYSGTFIDIEYDHIDEGIDKLQEVLQNYLHPVREGI